MWWHALPENWTDLSYQDFLEQRRKLIAEVTNEGFKKLSDPNYTPSAPVSQPTREPALPTFEQLVHNGNIPPNTTLVPSHGESESEAQVTEDGLILFEGEEYMTPQQAAHADGAHYTDGWSYWSVSTADGKTLEDIRSSSLVFT